MTNEIPEGMLAFDIMKALTGWPCVTRDGNEVRLSFISELEEDKECPLFGWVKEESTWTEGTWDIYGFANEDKDPCPWQLFLKKKTKTYWQNIYKNKDGDIYVKKNIYKTQQEAKDAGELCIDYLKTISFEVDDFEPAPKKKKTKKLWIAISKYSRSGVHRTSNATESLEELNKNFDPAGGYWFKEIEVECE